MSSNSGRSFISFINLGPDQTKESANALRLYIYLNVSLYQGPTYNFSIGRELNYYLKGSKIPTSETTWGEKSSVCVSLLPVSNRSCELEAHSVAIMSGHHQEENFV